MMNLSRRIFLLIISIIMFACAGSGQVKQDSTSRILFHGIVMDAGSLTPIGNSQIIINRAFSSVSGQNGNFSFYVNRNDTVVFKSLGYKPAIMLISDTLTQHDFIAGIYLNSDTLAIPEVIILPRYTSIKSEILNSKSKVPEEMENARYNVAISAYQAKTTQGNLTDPASNYSYLHQQQKIDAFEKGGIPSDRIVGLNPLLLIPGVAYLLIQGLPEKPPPLRSDLAQSELDQLNKRYLETLEKRK
jgi:hypothetical protein